MTVTFRRARCTSTRRAVAAPPDDAPNPPVLRCTRDKHHEGEHRQRPCGSRVVYVWGDRSSFNPAAARVRIVRSQPYLYMG